jgi:hypothetical protein
MTAVADFSEAFAFRGALDVTAQDTMFEKPHLTGEERLVLAILEDAAGSVRRVVVDRLRGVRVLPKNAAEHAASLEWIGRRDWSWPWSFASCCDTLKLDPDYVEGLIRELEFNAQAAIERGEIVRRNRHRGHHVGSRAKVRTRVRPHRVHETGAGTAAA